MRGLTIAVQFAETVIIAKSVIAQFSMNSHPEEESVDEGYDENGYDRPSKSQVKREMHALLDLGKQRSPCRPNA